MMMATGNNWPKLFRAFTVWLGTVVVFPWSQLKNIISFHFFRFFFSSKLHLIEPLVSNFCALPEALRIGWSIFKSTWARRRRFVPHRWNSKPKSLFRRTMKVVKRYKWKWRKKKREILWKNCGARGRNSPWTFRRLHLKWRLPVLPSTGIRWMPRRSLSWPIPTNSASAITPTIGTTKRVDSSEK